MRAALTRYRVMAYIVGVLLLILLFVHMPLEYIWHNDALTPVAILHGWMFMLYVATVIDLAMRCRWQIFPRTILVALAGTIPFLSFVAEHKATQWAKAAIAASEGTSGAPEVSAEPTRADN